MKSTDFIVILVTIAHQNKWAIVNLWLEKHIRKGMFFR